MVLDGSPPENWVGTYGHQWSPRLQIVTKPRTDTFEWPMWQGAGLPVCWVIFLNPADMDKRANTCGKTGAATILVKTDNADGFA